MGLSFNMAYFVAKGLAFSKGLDFFEKSIPKEEAWHLFKGFIQSCRKKNKESAYISFLISLSARKHKWLMLEYPPCEPGCRYRLDPSREIKPQKNALRIEFFTPAVRCGFQLKNNRIGGCWSDYKICSFPDDSKFEDHNK